MNVTLIKEDKLIIVNGEALEVDYAYPENLWAIQWDGEKGEAEWTDKANTEVTADNIQPYIDAWQAVKDSQPEPELPPEPTYTDLRAAAYPSIQDQLDMQYWDKVNGTNQWQQAITTVKATYPKED